MTTSINYKEKPDNSDSIRKILNPVVEKWFFSRFKEFSLPQLYAVKEIHERKNVLVSAPTGATKTLTAFMAILNELVNASMYDYLEDKVYCIYISPLKALSNDIQRNLLEPLAEIEKICGKELGIRVETRTGDTTAAEKNRMLKKVPHILITTPESLAIVLSSIKFKEHLKHVQWVVVDEIHALAENKRGVHLSLSMERLQYLNDDIIRIGLSATVAPLDEIAKYLVGTNRSCEIIDVQFIKQMDLKVISPVPDLINISYDKLQSKLYDLMHDLIQQHKTTLVFTNTRAGTERVVHKLKDLFSKHYGDHNSGAHHGSLSTEHRRKIENDLKDGKLKFVVCSTSLELGIDIGYVDLVICIGSPKSVARALQRIGRSGHQLHSITKGRIIVMDRDDLVECSVLLKSAIEKKIDKIDIPKNCLDVLSQHIFGMALEKIWQEDEMFAVIRNSYCYYDLKINDFNEVLDYLAGNFVSLEDRYIYAKIWREDKKIGKKGKLSRLIYMTNVGTIPDQSGVTVKVNGNPIGTIDETFLERLNKGDIFVLGGSTYEFIHAKGMVANVKTAYNRTPTVPSWFSEMLPLSFDLSQEIGKFRRLMKEYFDEGLNKKDTLKFINDYLYVDGNSAEAVYSYFFEQYAFLKIIPNDKEILVEDFTDDAGEKKIVFHTLFGRRVNDVLSRAIAYTIASTQKKNVSIGVNDNGFYVSMQKGVNVMRAVELLNAKDLRKIMEKAVDDSEILRRRFRHCATRALMILRNYKGKIKRAGRQQVSSMRLLKSVKEISFDFSVLKEARREVLEDQMDIKNAEVILKAIEAGEIKFIETITRIPSPFAFNIALQGVMDVIKIEDRMEFLQRMHNLVLAKIAIDNKVDMSELVYNRLG